MKNQIQTSAYFAEWYSPADQDGVYCRGDQSYASGNTLEMVAKDAQDIYGGRISYEDKDLFHLVERDGGPLSFLWSASK